MSALLNDIRVPAWKGRHEVCPDELGATTRSSMVIAKAVNLALAFLLELCALAAFAFWGSHAASGTVSRVGQGLGAPLLMAVVWATLLAPRAPVKVPAGPRLVLSLAVFSLAAVALAAAGQTSLAWVFAALVVLNFALRRAWGQ